MIFILGIERSATTWVANILDHHPQTDVFMEPLSAFNSRFREWPGRFEELENYGEKAAYFNEEFEILKKHRRFLLTRLSNSADAWNMDLEWAQFLVNKKLAPDSVNDFLELNFHRKGRGMTISKEPTLQTVIKELRLNFKAELLPHLHHHPKVLISIREMASTVRSILQQIKQGNLVELKKDLLNRYDGINPQSVCRYWIESYEALIESLQVCKIDHRIVSHTALLQRPAKTVDGMFNFLGLEAGSTAHHYLNQSNQSGEGKHSTLRSRDEVLEQMKRDGYTIYPKVDQQLKHIQNHPVLKNFVKKA